MDTLFNFAAIYCIIFCAVLYVFSLSAVFMIRKELKKLGIMSDNLISALQLLFVCILSLLYTVCNLLTIVYL